MKHSPLSTVLRCSLIALALFATTALRAQTTYTRSMKALESGYDQRSYLMDQAELQAIIDGNGNFQIGFWFQVKAIPSSSLTFQSLFCLNVDRGKHQLSDEIAVTIGSGATLRLRYNRQTATSSDVYTNYADISLRTINAGDWHYFVIERNGTDLDVYIDNAFEASTGSLGSTFALDTGDFSLSLGGRKREYTVVAPGNVGIPIYTLTSETDALFHTFSTFAGSGQTRDDFQEEVERIGPVAFSKLSDGTISDAATISDNEQTTLRDVIGFYAPLQNSLGSESPGKVISSDILVAATDSGSLFSSVTQEFEGESYSVEIAISPPSAGAAVREVVSPAVGIGAYSDGETISFSAPEYIYVDRAGDPLPPAPSSELPSEGDIQNHAIARWRTLGYTVVGTTISGTDRAVDLSINADTGNITFEWQFEKELAVMVGSALPDGLDSLGSGNPSPAVQKHWVPEGTSQIATIDGAVIDPNSANDVRYRIRGYELQNHPDAPDQPSGSYFKLRGGNPTDSDQSSLDIDNNNGATVSYWVRVHPDQQPDSQMIWIGSTELRAGADGELEMKLLSSGTTLKPAGVGIGTDSWNHWTIVYDKADGGSVRLYINGREVASADGEAIYLTANFQIGSRGSSGFSSHFDIDDLRIWNRTLGPEEIAESMTAVRLDGHPALSPTAELTFDSPPTGTVNNLEYDLTADVELLLAFSGQPSRQRSNRYFVPVDYNDPQQIPEFIVNRYTVIRWHWQKEYLIENITVNGLFDPALSLRVGSEPPLDSAGFLWVPHGESLQVTADKVADGSSANGFVGQPTGLFENLAFASGNLIVSNTIANLTDSTNANEYRLDADYVDKPGRVIWNYGETIHVVEIPLGTALDPTGGAILSPAGNLSSLGLSSTSVAPFSISMLIGNNPNDATVDNVARWDAVGRKLYPVRPGEFLLSWPMDDGSGDKSIRVIAGFPNDSYTWDDGSERSFAGTGGKFPGTPIAHYRPLYNPELNSIARGKNPPLELDGDPADRWFLDPTRGLAYSERITRDGGVVTESSLAKTSIDSNGRLQLVEDSRSVLVFSARPIAEEVATGDLQREELLVRVVESKPISAATYRQSELSTGDGYVGKFDGSTLVKLENGPDPNGSMTVDFWARRTGDPIKGWPDAVFSAGDVRSADKHWLIGFAADSAINPNANGAFIFQVIGRGQVKAPVELTDRNWHHWAVTYDVQTSWVSIYRDGVLVKSQSYSANLNAVNDYSIGKSIPTNGGGQPFKGRVDNLRMWAGLVMDADQIAELPFTATPAIDPDLNFTFDDPATGVDLPQSGLLDQTATVEGSAAADPNSLLLLSDVDAAPEVATRLTSRFDRAGFGTGFVIPTISNYNTSLYNRGAAVGEWGPIYAVNSSDAAGADEAGAGSDSPTTVWYDNLSMPDSLQHPNVDWPNVALEYSEVRFPQTGPHKDNRIHIASRIGSEGVDLNGDQQLVFDVNRYTNLTIYNQPDRDAAGYNPNEEHALVAPSVRHLIGGATPTNNPPEAVFALRDDLNFTNVANFTSEPWVLAQYTDDETGEQEMMAWKVEKTRSTSVVEGANLETRPSLYPTLNYDKSDITSFLRPLPSQPASPTYDFHYPVFAGDSLGFPYPLGNVIGAVVPPETSVTELDSRRVFWKDHKGNPWVVSGREPIVSPDTTPEHEAQFNARLWYPLKAGFWFDLDDDGTNDVELGTSIPWLPENGIYYVGYNGNTAEPIPQQIRYEAFWKNDYPVLKAGETATFAGGEYKKDRPEAKGLPAIVGMAAAQVIFDTKNPAMAPISSIAGATTDSHSARIIRPLDQLILDIDPAVDFPTGLTPANGNILARGTKWFFTDLSASLQNRIYYDIIQEKIVLRGLLNDRDIADPDLTMNPIALYVLEPNVLNASDLAALQDLDDKAGTPDAEWDARMSDLYELSRNPTGLDLDSSGVADTTADDATLYYPGLMPLINTDSSGNFLYDTDPLTGLRSLDVNKKKAEPLMSVGAGSAMVPSPDLFKYTEDDFESPLYVTVAENNHPDLGAAPVSLHVVRISPQRFRGGVKMILAPNAFDEKVTLRHTADFGGATENMEFEWYTAEVDGEIPETTPDTDLAAWGGAAVAGESLPSFDLVGLPSRLLSDQWVYARYRHQNEGGYRSAAVPLLGAGSEESAWEKPSAGGVGGAAPFQWAGANNSPQIQADGSLRYIPALALGWVKRVLDRINPYEARINDFYNNESPATYTSMIQQAGARPLGPVALNSDKDVVENVGLIALYQTVLDRAYDLASAEMADTNGIQQAILLASSRISDFYNLIGNEAYSDALDPTIGLGTGSVEFGKFAPAVWSFQNEESSLLNEELGLLRGSDFAKAWPVDNRLFWNFVKGEGEAAYANNYGISDVNLDGFINEFDAAELYPQGHGDAWGQYGSALRTHYRLLQTPFFRWLTRAEFYNLADNVLEVDYLDEQKFAETAASRARVGSAIVQQTYRAAYTADPDGQWQGYTDVDADRAWGVKGWGKRAGQGAYFDWLAANSLLPETAPDRSSGLPAENLEKLDRSTITAAGEIAAALNEIQVVLDDATLGITPVGIGEETVPFDIDPARLDRGSPYPFTATHFEQIYERAMTALGNAVTAFDYANEADKRLRQVAINTEEYTQQAYDQDVAFRNQLKEMFGSPYEGTIGAGKLYPSGYEGPDLFLWPYVDADSPLDYFPDESPVFADIVATSHKGVTSVDQGFINLYFMEEANKTLAGFFSTYLNRTFGDIDEGDPLSDAEIFDTGTDLEALFRDFDLPLYYERTYGLQAPPAWGSRAVTGRIQSQVNRMTGAQIELHIAIDDYQAYMRELQADIGALLDRQEILLENVDAANALLSAQKVVEAAFLVADVAKAVIDTADSTAEGIRKSINDSLPTVLGVANDPSWGIRGPVTAAYVAASVAFDGAETGIEIAKTASEYAFSVVEGNWEIYDYVLGEQEEFIAASLALQEDLNGESTLRYAIATAINKLEAEQQEFSRLIDQGTALLQKRQTANQRIAANVQRERYNDMTLRVSHNDALQKYRASFEIASRYAYLAAKAYAYETNLSDSHPANARGILTDIVAARLPGHVVDGEPQINGGGLAESLAKLKANYDVLNGQLGFNNPQTETGKFSLRRELFRVKKPELGDASSSAIKSDEKWRESLGNRYVANLWHVPEFRTYCRTPWGEDEGPQPGLVIPFGSEIFEGKNFFGWPLGGGDQSYDASQFATKIRSAGVWLEGYDGQALAVAPRVWLVPAGDDVMRIANSSSADLRRWSVVDQAVPTPFQINLGDLGDDTFIPGISNITEPFGAIRKFSRFRAYHDDGSDLLGIDDEELSWDNRLVGRSVWNTKWLLIIPGSTFSADAKGGLDKLIGTKDSPGIRDIRLLFKTYSASGN